MPWFAVKTFLRSRPKGRPRARDEHYRAGLAAIEERVVLFRARSGASAIRKAKKEATRYIRDSRCINVYGQEVVAEMLSHVEAYEMFEPPDDGEELFSSTEIVRDTESHASIIARKVGEEAGPSTARLFIAGRIADELSERLGEW
jgi:Domain of unknown function (DUF4288)